MDKSKLHSLFGIPGSDTTGTIVGKAFDALKVVALDPKIRAFLKANDPKALDQVETAIILLSEKETLSPKVLARREAIVNS